MSNEMTVFTNEDFGQVRTVIRDGEPWFVAADVCKALEIANNRDAIGRLDSDEKAAVGLTDISCNGVSQQREYAIINEPGLYTLVLGSRKPEAKAFKRWITHDVIPSIRKVGSYNADPRQVLIDNFGQFSDATKQAMILDLYDRTEQLTAKIEEDKPKVELANQIEASVTSLLVRDYCKVIQKNGLNIGEKRLYKWMIENKYLDEKKLPYQRYIDYFEVIERNFAKNGITYLSHTTRITGKGQVYFTEKLVKEFSKSLAPVACN